MTARVRTDICLPAALSMRSRLRLSCGVAALAAAVAMASPQQAKAQAFQGNETVVAGSASRTITSTTSETITVFTPTATINWSPYDTEGTGTVNFLPSGHTATFTNDPQSTADFTVLNRILPLDSTRPISLNGHVISQLQDLSGNVTRGGNVWFYSPGGIMIGATAVFDVGGLLLSVNDAISWSTTSTGFTGQFTRSDSNAQVNIASGAQINALANNSYVAIVAPRVEQHGSIRVDGAAVLAAGQDVSLTMNQGLFDIVVNVGTDDPNGVVHTGSTGGPSSSAAGDNHRVYMVAVPKNQALTMLLSGNVGFDPATVAGVDNGEIVLGAGWSIFENSGQRFGTFANANAGIVFGPGSYTSAVDAVAMGNVTAIADTGSIAFDGNVSLASFFGTSGANIQLGASNGQSLTVGGNLSLRGVVNAGPTHVQLNAATGGNVAIGGFLSVTGGAAADGTPGSATLSASGGGTLTVGGQSTIDVGVGAASPDPQLSSADNSAGAVIIQASDNGSISLGNLSIFASANGQDNNGNGDGIAGNGQGGTIDFSASSGGAVTVNGNLFASAVGTGGNMLTGSTAGGVGTGGTVNLTADSGAVTVAGTTTLIANGTGGSSSEGATGTQAGGAGIGGRVGVLVQGTGQLTLQNTLLATASGIGGTGLGGGASGSGNGGFVGFYARDGGVATAESLGLSANGTGGSSGDGDGGAGTGGSAQLVASGGGDIAANSGTVQAEGRGGSGSVTAGTGHGGLAEVAANGVGSSVNIAAVGSQFPHFSASGYGGANTGSGDGGAGTGGRLVFFAGAGGHVSLPIGAFQGGVLAWARGFGGAGGEGGTGGFGQGGTLEFGTDGAGSALSGGGMSLSSNGLGAFRTVSATNSNGGDAAGGTTTIFANNGGVTTLTNSFARASGIAGRGFGTGNGGDGVGGTLNVHVDAGRLELVGTSPHGGVSFGAGGGGGEGVIGGDGTGGRVSMFVTNGGEINATSPLADAEQVNLVVFSQSSGGAGTVQGGEGRAGSVGVDVSNGGSITANSAAFVANGYGGGGLPGATGAAGDGFGGQVLVRAGADGVLSFDRLDVETPGYGGGSFDGTASVAGSDGTGGTARVVVDGGTLNVTGTTNITANGTGGDGQNGGDGVGGSAGLLVFSGSAPLGPLTNITATGIGGSAITGFGGHGGAGTGGTAYIQAMQTSTAGGTITGGDVVLDVSGTGGTGGAGDGGSIAAGAGGDGRGGAFQGSVNSGGAFALAQAGAGSLQLANVTMRSQGTGGAGGAGGAGQVGGAGGNGTGGSTQAGTFVGGGTGSAGNASFTSVSGDASGFGGAGGTGTTQGAAGTGTGGGAVLIGRVAPVQVSSVTLTSNGTAGSGSGPAVGRGGSTLVLGTEGGNVAIGSLVARASGVPGGADSTTEHGQTTINANGAAVTLGSVSMEALGTTARSFTVDGVTHFYTPRLRATDGTLTITGNASITSGTDVEVEANSGGRIEVGGNLTLASTGANGDIGVHAIDSGQIAVTGTLSASTAPAGSDGGDISLGHRTTEGQPTEVTGPSITAGNLVLSGGGDVSIDAVEVGGTASITYADDVELGYLRAGSSIRVSLAAALDPEAEGHSALITGLVAAPNMSIESGALQIAETGQLGEAGFTDSLELIARSFGTPVIVGGSDETGTAQGQYHLTQAEAERIEASAVTFRATSATAQSPQVVVRDLTIQGSAGGGTSSVRLITPGSVRVEGDLAYIDAAATDALTISANERLEVITPDGSIRMVDPDGGLAGVLTLQSSNVVVTDAALAARLADDPNFAGRDEALATNNGPVNEAGYLEAGGIRLLTSENIFIQNSGTATEFAGLTVGGQGLLVGRYQASTNPDGSQSFSFVGTLTTADDVLLFDFTITSQTQITLRTYSYAGGVNGAGQTIPAGGFDPILALFNAAGTLIDQNDDGGSNVPADPTTGSRYDTFLQAMLPPGTYTVAVTAFSNFANGPNLSDGFEGGGSFNGRTPNFAFDVIGADLATGPGDSGPITVVAFGRMQNADGSFTGGADFFTAVDFGTQSGVQYVEGSTFNGFQIGQPLPPPPPPVVDPPPPPPPPPPPGTNLQTVLGSVELILSQTGTDPEDQSDASGTGISTSTSLVSTGPGVLEGLLDEAVTSGGDTSQWIEDEEDDDCETGDERQQCQERTN